LPPAPSIATARTRTGWRSASQCEVCRCFGDGRVCGACIARHASPRPRCATCAAPTGVAVERCGECLREPPPWSCAVTAVDYGFPWNTLVKAFKFDGRTELAGVLAGLLGGAIDAAPGAARAVDLVAAVPLAPARLADRGFNQSWELARRLARRFALPAEAMLLRRPVDSAHQTMLTRAERAANLQGAFMVDPARRAALGGRRVALVDDVVTTGATVRAATLALERAGAAAVVVWAFARTP
jgi:ComF family protein